MGGPSGPEGRSRGVGGPLGRSMGGPTGRSMCGPPKRDVGEADITFGLVMGRRMSASRAHAEPGRDASDVALDEEGTAKGIAIGGRSLSIGARSLSIGSRSLSIGGRSLSSGGLPCGKGGRTPPPAFDEDDAERRWPSKAVGGEVLCIAEATLMTSAWRSYSLGGRGLMVAPGCAGRCRCTTWWW
ncbi:hypothetical protein HDZ31DRAFT_43567 [Schizophyllum fasciatum]